MDNYALLAEMGTGKSGAMVNILRQRYAQYDRVLRTLIVAPQVTLFNWLDEIEKHSYIKRENIIILHKQGSAGKLKQLDRELLSGINRDKIIVVNYEALIADKLLKVINDWGPEVMVLDESHYVKSHKTKRSKKIHSLSRQCKHRYIMTGTPILNNITDIFMQYKILDGGETFGDSYFVFQKKYMRDENEAWKGRSGYFPKWVPRAEKYDELQSKIYTKATRILKDECLDLPPLIRKTLTIEMSPKQRTHYKEMQRDFLTYVNSEAVVAELAVTKALRLQQIVTGFVQTEKGQVLEIPDNPRLNAVKELLQSLHENHKVILWCSFRHNYKQLSKVCEELGIEHVFLTGEQSLEEKRDAMAMFNNDRSCRVVIANRRAGGIGVNLVAADYSIVYSRNFNLSDELQSEARNHRGGSQIHERIVKIDLCAKDTIDEAVTIALQNKQDISNRIIDLVKEEQWTN
jgi:SNF2 family DNA or RNA helicase